MVYLWDFRSVVMKVEERVYLMGQQRDSTTAVQWEYSVLQWVERSEFEWADLMAVQKEERLVVSRVEKWEFVTAVQLAVTWVGRWVASKAGMLVVL